jgi:hypothetical protein
MIYFFDRLDKFMQYKGLNDNKITVSAGVSNGLIGKGRQRGALSQDSISKILCAYPELDANWLLTGKGDMLKSDSPAPPIHNINVEPSPGSQASPKSPEPISVDFSLILERYEYLAGEAARLKDEKARTDVLQAENGELKTENRELRAENKALRTENERLKKYNLRSSGNTYKFSETPLEASQKVAEPKEKYEQTI